MHEMAWAQQLVLSVTSLARQRGAGRVLGVTVRVGPHAGLSLERVREHFVAASRGTIVEGAWLTVREPVTDKPPIDDVAVLESIEVET